MDPGHIVDGAGWAGAGLLGLVLAWLFFFHIPAKDKQVQDLNNALLAANKVQGEVLAAVADKHKAALDVVVAHCKEDSNRILEAFRAELRAGGARRAQQT